MSNDKSTCYEDYTLNSSEDFGTEWPMYKKRKIDAEKKVIQKNIVKEKPIHNNGYETFLHEQQNNNLIQDQQLYKNALAHIQAPNLSDSDSNDTFPAVTSSGKMSAYIYLYNK